MNEPQPAPTGYGLEVWLIVIGEVRTALRDRNLVGAKTLVPELMLFDMQERNRIGTERYGTPLRTDNGRDALIDCYQELLDHVVYLKQYIIEHPGSSTLREMYYEQLNNLVKIRAAIYDRDGN